MGHPFNRSNSALLAAAMVLAVCLASAATSVAKPVVHQVGASKTTKGKATFKLGGLPARRVVSGSLNVAHKSRRLRKKLLVRAIRKGKYTVSLRRAERRVLRRSKQKPKLRIKVRPAVPTAPSSPAPGSVPTTPLDMSLYGSDSPFNTRLPADPAIDPRSDEMVQSLIKAKSEKGFPLSVREWTVPIYVADGSTPRYDVQLGKASTRFINDYGTAPDEQMFPPGSFMDQTWRRQTTISDIPGVPIPDGAAPDPMTDGHMTVIDQSTGCEYDFYGAEKRGDQWQAIWANSTRIDGSGVYPMGLSSKGTGFAGAAGLVWPGELRDGHIDHTLFFTSPYTKSGGPVAPATAADGQTNSSSAIPEGARIQLDPDLDLSTLDLKPYELTMAKAMQQYGLILGDTGGAMATFAVSPQSYDKNPYEGLLPDDPYAYLSKIPVDKFRVLQLPPQQPVHLGIVPAADCAQMR